MVAGALLAVFWVVVALIGALSASAFLSAAKG